MSFSSEKFCKDLCKGIGLAFIWVTNKASSKSISAIALTALALGQPTTTRAADPAYPTKPIRIIVTFPPGGSTDALIRIIAPRLTEQLGQPIVVVNQPGAGGNIGLTTVARAEPDGHTIGMGAAGALSINPSLYPKMPYDPATDFRPISMLAMIPFVLIGNTSAMKAQTLGELIESAKSQPGKLTVGHGGNGTGMHLTAALFAQMANVNWTEVPFKGSGQATMEVLGGQISLAVSDLPASLDLIRTGRLKAYAVTSKQRLAALPDVPTMAEAGLPGYESVGWFGIVAPAGTPEPIVLKLNAAFQDALNNPALRTSIRNLGVEPGASSPQEFEAFIKSETKKWSTVVKNAAIQLN